jgi:hypothetical protein
MCGCRKRAAAGGAPAPTSAPPAPPRAPPAPRTVRTVVRAVVRSAPAPAPAPVVAPPIIDPAEWGPQLWFVLHTLGELAGGPAVFQRIPRVLAALAANGLRCPECQAHFSAWVAAHPFPTGRLPRDQALTAARQWVLDLHNNVNERRTADAAVPEEGALSDVSDVSVPVSDSGTSRVVAPAWSAEQVAAAYGGDRRAIRRAAIDRLRQIRGKIAEPAFRVILNTLAQG